MSKIPKAEQAGPSTTGLQVTARSDRGIRRAGRHFGPEACTPIPLDELTKADYEAINSEPGLVVVEVDLTPAAAPAKK